MTKGEGEAHRGGGVAVGGRRRVTAERGSGVVTWSGSRDVNGRRHHQWQRGQRCKGEEAAYALISGVVKKSERQHCHSNGKLLPAELVTPNTSGVARCGHGTSKRPPINNFLLLSPLAPLLSLSAMRHPCLLGAASSGETRFSCS